MNRYTIGGVAFSVAESLPGLAADGFADAEIAATFGAKDPYRDLSTVRRVTGPGDLHGAIDTNSMTCWLPDRHQLPMDRAWHLRQVAPVFSSLLDRLVLHASAVETEAGVFGFIGETGAGKSTLAAHLSGHGYRLAADDLMPVRFAPFPQAPVGCDLRPIAGLVFLERGSIPGPIIEPLGAVDALRLMIANGFGEHGDDRAWAFQFDAYHRLGQSVRHWALSVPDDLAALTDVSEAIAGLAQQIR